MIRLYEENPEFGQYSKYCTDTGELVHIQAEEFTQLKKSCETFGGPCQMTRTNFPRRVYFQITRSCNLNCGYCFIKADVAGAHLNTNSILAMARYFGDKGLMEVRLTGGEPTVHPDFKLIHRRFREENIYVSLATNCVWSEDILDYLCAQDDLWIIASIDGSREVHNRYRNNSYDTAIGNLQKLRRRNSKIRLRLNTVLTRENMNDLEHLARLSRELQAESITLIPLRPQVRDPAMLGNMLTAAEFKNVLAEMVEYKKRYGVKFTTTIETVYKNEIMKDKIFEKRSSCAAGREGTNLDFDAASQKFIVYACSYCPASDLYEKPYIRAPFLAGTFDYNETGHFGDIWDDNANWEIFRDLSLKSDGCHSCAELGKRCTGSCPIQNINLNEINEEIGVKREIIRQMKQNAEWYCYKRYSTSPSTTTLYPPS